MALGLTSTVFAVALLAMQPTAVESVENSADVFLAQNSELEGVVTTASGLQYRILEEGDSEGSPAATDTVLVNYVGRIPNGRLFDTAMRSPLSLDGVIAGWTEGLQLMSRGGRYIFWVPPALGYGATPPPTSPITAETVMEFEIELTDFISTEQLLELQRQREALGNPAPVPEAELVE